MTHARAKNSFVTADKAERIAGRMQLARARADIFGGDSPLSRFTRERVILCSPVRVEHASLLAKRRRTCRPRVMLGEARWEGGGRGRKQRGENEKPRAKK